MQPHKNGPRYLWSVLEERLDGVQGVFLPGHSPGGPRDSRQSCGAGRGQQLTHPSAQFPGVSPALVQGQDIGVPCAGTGQAVPACSACTLTRRQRLHLP